MGFVDVEGFRKWSRSEGFSEPVLMREDSKASTR
jgi:hypothetical protein